MLRTLLTRFACGLLAATPLIGHAQIDYSYSEDFEGEFPGPGIPAAIAFTFGGTGGGTNPFPGPGGTISAGQQEISIDGVGGSQAYKVSFDAAGATDFYFAGWGIFTDFFGNSSRSGGFSGADDPANWVYSLDVRGIGVTGERALEGEFVYFDPDYEATFSVDTNGDGDMDDGAETYILKMDLVDDPTDSDFTTNMFRLNAGSEEATTTVDGDIPRFNDDGTWVLRFALGSGEYGFTDGNEISIDNLSITFSEILNPPGDYNDDGIVDAADYTVFRDSFGQSITLPNEGTGVTPGVVTEEDYNFWASQYGATASPSSLAVAVPEATSTALAVLGLIAACAFDGKRCYCRLSPSIK